jgi:hypothetical protein
MQSSAYNVPMNLRGHAVDRIDFIDTAARVPLNETIIPTRDKRLIIRDGMEAETKVR